MPIVSLQFQKTAIAAPPVLHSAPDHNLPDLDSLRLRQPSSSPASEAASSTPPDGASQTSSADGSSLAPAAVMSCLEGIAPTSQSFTPQAGSGTIGVTGDVGCNLTALPSDTWITIGSTANNTVTYSVTANTASIRRVGTITIGAHIFTVLQGASFTDVPVGLFYKEIGKLSARG